MYKYLNYISMRNFYQTSLIVLIYFLSLVVQTVYIPFLSFVRSPKIDIALFYILTIFLYEKRKQNIKILFIACILNYCGFVSYYSLVNYFVIFIIVNTVSMMLIKRGFLGIWLLYILTSLITMICILMIQTLNDLNYNYYLNNLLIFIVNTISFPLIYSMLNLLLNFNNKKTVKVV